jgi:N-acetyl-anhydromuramyl-L-alanine amidase AmpD
MGQRLLIPQAAAIRPVINLYPSRKWKYIIIHHSATDEGDALAFHKLHRNKGWETVGYHFVVDNGTIGKKAGAIEASPRWIKQQNGAHCKASQMNYQGIGVCLVGNFNIERVSREQMESLLYLVNTLRHYYKIPTGNIIGHGSVPGAKTDCPGKNFPWAEFKNRLKGSA